MKKILSIIIIIVLSTILGLAYNASTNLSLRLLEADDDVRPFREDFNYNFELVDDLFDDVSLIEFGYLDGVTSAIQTQFNAKQPLDAQLTDVAGLAVTDGGIIVGDGTNFVLETGATARSSLGLTIGTHIQAYDAGLLSIAGLTTAANKSIYTTALDTYEVYTLTAFGRSILDDADASTARGTLGIDLSLYYLKTEINTQGEMETIWGDTLMNDLVDDAAPELGGTLDHNNERDTEVKTIEFNGLYANGNSGATPTVDWQNGNYQSITISENALLTFSNVFVGTITLVMTYTTGDYTLGFDAGYTIHEEGGTEISFTETDGAIDILKVMYLGSANNFVVGAMLDVKD